MTNRIADTSPRKAALVAGLGLLLMMIPAVFANFFVIESLIVPGDAATTANNVMANESLFRIGICGLIVVLVLDVLVAWGLYVFLKRVNKSLSLLTAWFRLLYVAMLGASLAGLLGVLGLLGGADYLTAFETDQLQAQVMLFVNVFHYGESIAYVFFGLHLLILGYLVFKSGFSGYIPKILGVLLAIAGLGYLIDNYGNLLIPTYDATISLFTFIGELLFMLWLLWKGIKGFDRDAVEKTNAVEE
jgi:hypothetical protein